MSKPRYAWWGYVKDMIRKYPDRAGKDLSITQQKEFEAVREALEETEALHEGKTRLEIIKLVFWDKSHTLVGAAEKEYCSLSNWWHRSLAYLSLKNLMKTKSLH